MIVYNEQQFKVKKGDVRNEHRGYTDAQLVHYRQERISLTPGEYRLLEVLMSRPGRIHTRAALLDMIQLEVKDITDRTIDVMFAHMRPKLGAWAAHIETARGIGYRLVP